LEEAATSDRHYMAIAFASGRRAASVSLRNALLDEVGEQARVLRTTVAVSAVLEVAPDVDVSAEAAGLRDRLAATLGDPALAAGVAGPRSGATGAHYALVQAEHALVVGRALRGDGRTTHFDDLGPFCFVLNQPVADVRAFAERILGPLIEDDRHSELVDTLEAYLRTEGNLNKVARQLFLHRNTVRHRLKRIAKLTGTDLSDPDMRLALRLAILGQRALARMAS
jgi:DNA-binding PucR family transcriptional regulator